MSRRCARERAEDHITGRYDMVGTGANTVWHWRRVALGAIALTLSACGSDALDSPTGLDPSFGVGDASVPWVTRVAGGGSAHFPTGVLQNVRAHATEWADGSVTGLFSAHARVRDGQSTIPIDFDWEFDVEIDCLKVSGGQAWMGGTVTRMKKLKVPGPFPATVGTPIIFVTKDRNADPSIPPGFFGPAGAFGTDNCQDMPEPPPLAPGAVITGGFTIMQR
jgi:hypothetical protein